jgi:hypothetical protein
MKNLNHSLTSAARLFAAVLLLASPGSAVAGVHYVDVTSTNATPPYTNWITAATNIQDAVDAAVAGDEIVVTNGIYANGGRAEGDGMFNRVAVDKPLSLRSVKGPQFTTIYGGGHCAYLTNDATLSGFTLTNGRATNGGGVWCESLTAVVSNCVVRGNIGFESGGGAYGGTLNNCVLTGNSAGHNGGGAAYCTLNNCVLTGNSATYRFEPCFKCSPPYSGDYGDGGGAAYCTLLNCILDSNYARNTSGYPDPSRYFGDYGRGGGAYNSWLLNCVVFLNNLYACPGSWFQDSDPRFLDQASGNLRLQPNSPCINAGNNSYVTSATDLDGNPRISGGIVDIGAYEFQWPQLTIAPSGPNVLLRWPTNNAGYDYTGFTLQSTTNLVSPAVWATNSPAPVIVNGQNTVTNPISGPQQFYRLSH